MNFYNNLSRFQKQFLYFFIICSIVVFILPIFITGNSVESIFSFLGILGLLSTICGILESIYMAKANPVAYIWWGLSTLAMAIICFYSSLYGQFIQNLFISLPIEIYGYFAWIKNIKNSQNKNLEIRKFGLKESLRTFILTIISWIAYGIFLYKLPSIMFNFFGISIAADPNIVLDSLTAILGIVASVLTNLRYIEQWYFWIIYDGIAIITFIIQISTTKYVGDISVLIADISNTLNLIQYVVGVIYGYILWLKVIRYKGNKIEKKNFEGVKGEYIN